jgi:rare lipoprotein A
VLLVRTVLLCLFVACMAATLAQNEAHAYSEYCEASYYGPGFVGQYTASGDIYTGEAGTAAHPYLPFGTVLYVESYYGATYLTVTDRGPYAYDRCLDVSWGSNWIVGYGVSPVYIEVVY